jgi:FixJ family two-component response regulator
MPTRAPVPNLVATSASAIVALSEDDALLRALTVAIVEQAAVVTSPSVDRFIDQLAANRAQVALIDAAAAPAPVDGFMARLHRQFPGVAIVLTGSAQLQTELSAQIADGTIFRFAHKPASAQRLKLFIHAALRRSQERAAAGEPAKPSETATATAPVRAGAGSGKQGRAVTAAAGRSEDGYRERTTRHGEARSAWPGWLWAMIGLALGALSVVAWLATGHALPMPHPRPP